MSSARLQSLRCSGHPRGRLGTSIGALCAAAGFALVALAPSAYAGQARPLKVLFTKKTKKLKAAGPLTGFGTGQYEAKKGHIFFCVSVAAKLQAGDNNLYTVLKDSIELRAKGERVETTCKPEGYGDPKSGFNLGVALVVEQDAQGRIREARGGKVCTTTLVFVVPSKATVLELWYEGKGIKRFRW